MSLTAKEERALEKRINDLELRVIDSYFDDDLSGAEQKFNELIASIAEMRSHFKNNGKYKEMEILAEAAFHILSSNPEKAIRELNKARKKITSSYTIYFKLRLWLAKAYMLIDMNDKALIELSRAENLSKMCKPEELHIDEAHRWILHYWRGVVLNRLGKYTEARKNLNLALKQTEKLNLLKRQRKFRAVTNNSLGFLEFKLGNFDEAREVLKKAKGDDDDRALYHNNFGYLHMVWAHFGHNPQFSDEAEDCFEKALARDKDNNPMFTHNMATWCFYKATDSTFSQTELQPDEQRDLLDKSVALYKEAREKYMVKKNVLQALACAYMEYSIKKLRPAPGTVGVNDKLIELGLELGEGLLSHFENFLVDGEIKQAVIGNYLLQLKSNEKIDSFFTVLRRWNSFTPKIPTVPEDKSFGGGYFLRWKGKGIVIDPGFDFLGNLYNAELSLDDIDAIIVTHSHLDHLADFEALMMMLHERNRYLLHSKRKKKVRLYLNNEVFKRYEHYYDGIKAFQKNKNSLLYRRRGETNKPFDLSKDIGADGKGFDIKLKIINTSHITYPHSPTEESLGLKLLLFDNKKDPKPALTLGITGDAVYSDTLRRFFLDCDILVGHIGSTSLKELAEISGFTLENFDPDFLNWVKSNAGVKSGGTSLKRDGRKLKLLGYKGIKDLSKHLIDGPSMGRKAVLGNHLGISGIYKLFINEKSKTRLFLISEYGEELGYMRYRITKRLNKYRKLMAFPTESLCLTSDTGLFIDLSAKDKEKIRILCNHCGELVDIRDINEVCLRQLYKSMAYYCEACKEEDLNPWVKSDKTEISLVKSPRINIDIFDDAT